MGDEMKIEIMHRITDAVIYAAEIPDETPSGMQMRVAMEKATNDGADLRGADLSGADLRGADLRGADLSGTDLSGANLNDADLSGADLRGADLSGEKLTKAPISILNLTWPILITEKYLRIGCQLHTHAEWAAFSDAEISTMENRALEFWQKWKAPLLAMCAAHGE